MKINGKNFDILIDRNEISTIVDNTIQTINKLPTDCVFVVMANGANWFSQKVFEHFSATTFDIEYALLKSYSGNQRDEIEVVKMPDTSLLQGKNIIILEDIIDSGVTMRFMIDWCKQIALANNIYVCPMAIREGVNAPDYNVANQPIVIPSQKWIVGCGLDYDHYGRNLPDLYYMVD